jgi:DNA-binding PadR family transcriptional regulator
MRTHRTFPGSTSFLILFALAQGPSSGAEIQKQIIADTGGDHIQRSTIYDDLTRMLAKGLIEQITIHGSEKVVALTPRGRKCLERETRLLQLLAVTARERVARL